MASSQGRDRSYLLNQAVDNYLDLQRHHAELIQKGLDDIKAGRTVTHEEIGQRIAAR